MELGLKGKRVLVSGGARGIGRACAAAFLAEGAGVAIVSRTQASVGAALAGLPGAIGFAADLCSEAQAEEVLRRVEQEIGPVDILVNSAGAARRSSIGELEPGVWKAAMDAKYFSYINLIDPAIKGMAARGRGVIVNIIGTGGKRPVATHLPGGAANAALMLATVGLGAAYAPMGVRVLGVSPGVTNTDRVREGTAAIARAEGIELEEALAAQVAAIPAGRMSEPEEIAATVVFLASGRAPTTTGTIITVDGGATASL